VTREALKEAAMLIMRAAKRRMEKNRMVRGCRGARQSGDLRRVPRGCDRRRSMSLTVAEPEVPSCNGAVG
jgi:hypothetical protein